MCEGLPAFQKLVLSQCVGATAAAVAAVALCWCVCPLLAAEQQAQQSQALKMFSALLGQQGSGQPQQGPGSTADQSAGAAGTNSLEVGSVCGVPTGVLAALAV